MTDSYQYQSKSHAAGLHMPQIYLKIAESWALQDTGMGMF